LTSSSSWRDSWLDAWTASPKVDFEDAWGFVKEEMPLLSRKLDRVKYPNESMR